MLIPPSRPKPTPSSSLALSRHKLRSSFNWKCPLVGSSAVVRYTHKRKGLPHEPSTKNQKTSFTICDCPLGCLTWQYMAVCPRTSNETASPLRAPMTTVIHSPIINLPCPTLKRIISTPEQDFWGSLTEREGAGKCQCKDF